MPFAYRNNGIPDRWLDYQAVGKRLPGSRFIAFKVPLKQSLNSHLPCPDVFGPWELLEALGKENEELGLLIDLTYTTRYYKLEDLPDSLLWVKIPTAGHAIPSDATILSFKRVIRRFLRDNANNDKLIGVHCTHGLNRTGYLVCRYLIDVDGVDPKEAVELFNSSRGHTIERQNYLEDLQSGPRRSNEGMEVSEQEPMRDLLFKEDRTTTHITRPHKAATFHLDPFTLTLPRALLHPRTGGCPLIPTLSGGGPSTRRRPGTGSLHESRSGVHPPIQRRGEGRRRPGTGSLHESRSGVHPPIQRRGEGEPVTHLLILTLSSPATLPKPVGLNGRKTS
ncbi:RNA/RNP complex-1-interacting phosphatase-like [Diretmus argenteus]